MLERPILFSAPMVRAILSGQKTQTRRVIKPQPDIARSGDVATGGGICALETPDDMRIGRLGKVIRCPYGQPGDRLWVRETWNARPVSEVDSGMYEAWAPYKAIPKQQPSNAWVYFEADGDEEGPWRPSIHMPRWASRITLEIIGVRVERLNDISEADCWAEGIAEVDGMLEDAAICDLAKRMGRSFEDAAPTFAALWESINGVGSWDANPWVWVVEFRRLIDG